MSAVYNTHILAHFSWNYSRLLQTVKTPASQNYSLRPRVHNRQLPDHVNYLTDSNFFVRMLFKNVY